VSLVKGDERPIPMETIKGEQEGVYEEDEDCEMARSCC
jgi:hypothetical protein